MNLKEQLYVTTLARCKTIAKASEELFITQPALSVYISNLEKYLGVNLFNRTGKEFQLTYVGQEYVRRAEKMLDMKREFDQIVHDLTRKYDGRIRIGIQHRRTVSLLPDPMLTLSREYPGVEVIIREGIHAELVEMFEKNQIDLFVGVFKDELANAEYVTLGYDHLLVVLPEGHPAYEKAFRPEGDASPYPYLDIRCLDRETFILPGETQSLRMSIDRIMEEYQIAPGKLIELSYFDTIMALVEKGFGIGFNRESYLDHMTANRKLLYCRIGDSTHDYTSRIVIARRKGKLPTYTRRMIELLVQQSTLSKN